MLSIEKAKYIEEYKIHLTFNNGKVGTADLKDFLFRDHRPIFSELKDQIIFQTFKVKHSTIVWSEELDLAPEYLFFLAFKNNKEYEEQFTKWGYVA